MAYPYFELVTYRITAISAHITTSPMSPSKTPFSIAHPITQIITTKLMIPQMIAIALSVSDVDEGAE